MIKVYINNEEVTFNKQITITQEILATSSVILNNCYPISWEDDKDYTSRFYFPKDYSRCEFYDDDKLIFAGVVKNTGNISLNPRYPKFCSLQILSFKTFLSEGKTLDFVIANKTIEEAIHQVTNSISEYGFVVGNVVLNRANDILGPYSTLEKSAYDVYQYLAEITGAKWYTRRVDKDIVAIDFYDTDSLPKAEDIEYTAEYFESHYINDMSFSYSTSDYRNKHIALSEKVYSNIDSKEQFVSNGYDTNFFTEKAIARINSITVDSESKTVATTDEKEIGITADFYFSIGESKFSSDKSYSVGSEIVINYIAFVRGREIAYNLQEISRINNQLKISGVISRYEERRDTLYSSQLKAIAKNSIKFKGKAEIILKIETTNSDLFFIGQQVYFNAPISELKTNYMIKKKSINFYLVGDEVDVFYTFELTSSFNSESAINFFDNQRSKSNGNISEGEYISRNVDIEDTANVIFNNLHIAEININPANSLESEFESILAG